MPKAYRRGYPVAVLVGIEQNHAALWQVFSQVAKQAQSIPLNGARSDPKASYSFHESIVNALRPTLKEGVRSIVVASPSKTNYAQEFVTHIKAHHNWLLQGANKAVFSTITGSASSPQQVAALTKTATFKELISEITSQETENLLEILEKRLNAADNMVFSLCKKQKTSSLTRKEKANLNLNISCLRMNILQKVARNTGFKDLCRWPQTKA